MKLLVYPVNENLVPLVRYKDLLPSYSEVIPVAPRGFGYEGLDAALLDGGPMTGSLVSCEFSEALQKADAVFFDHCDAPLNAGQYALLIRETQQAGKAVLLTKSLKVFLASKGVAVAMDGVSILGRPADDLLGNDEEKLLEIPVPCVVVLGTGRRTGKFDLQLNLRNVFQQAGYSVTQFGSKEYSSLFGFDPLPQFLFDLGSQREKILAFNHLVYETVKRDNSDVVLLGVPGGIMPINPFEFDEYGELAFLMGTAVHADTGICSLYCAPYPESVLENIRRICLYRHGVPIKYMNLSNHDLLLSQTTLECKYLTVPTEKIKSDILPQLHCPHVELFAASDISDMEKAGARILAELESYI